MKQFRRICSAFLVFALLLSMAQGAVFAAGEESGPVLDEPSFGFVGIQPEAISPWEPVDVQIFFDMFGVDTNEVLVAISRMGDGWAERVAEQHVVLAGEGDSRSAHVIFSGMSLAEGTYGVQVHLNPAPDGEYHWHNVHEIGQFRVGTGFSVREVNISPNPYGLGSGEKLQLSFFMEGLQGTPDLTLRLARQDDEQNFVEWGYPGCSSPIFENELDILPEFLREGNYRVLLGAAWPGDAQPPAFIELGVLEVKDTAPFTQVPEITSAYTTPDVLWAGVNGSFNFVARMTFPDYGAALNRKVLLGLYREGAGGQDELVWSDTLRLEALWDDELWLYPNISPSSLLAGDYYVLMDLNPGTEFLGTNAHRLLEFTVGAPVSSALSLLVNTDRGLVPVQAVGNRDVANFRLENWNEEGPPSYRALFLLPAGVEIGSEGWAARKIEINKLDYGNISFGGGQAVLPGVSLGAHSIPPGEYRLILNLSGGMLQTEPFSIFAGSTQAPPAVLNSVRLQALPDRQMYVAGEALCLDGLELWAAYQNSYGCLVEGYTTSPAEGSILTTANNRVTVSYTENGISKSASFSIKVLADEWTEHAAASLDGAIVIEPGSGNHSIIGTLGGMPIAIGEDWAYIYVKAGYEGVIRLKDVNINMNAFYRGVPIFVEENANVVFDLLGDNVLKSGTYGAGILVSENSEVGISSNTGGSLTAGDMASSAPAIGAGLVGINSGLIRLYGNAHIYAYSNTAAAIGGIAYRSSTATVLISGQAKVYAQSTYGAGIGGGAEISSGGQGGAGGTIKIRGNARVEAVSQVGAAIGGAFGGHSGGAGGSITIGGNAVVLATSTGSTAIGGGHGGTNGSGGHGGNVVVEGNARVSAVGGGIYATGIGAGPNNYYQSGNSPGHVYIKGGVVSAAMLDRGTAVSNSNSGSLLHISGGSLYAASGAVVNPLNPAGESLYAVKLSLQDAQGTPVNGARLVLGGGYQALTGGNPVWQSPAFTEESQPGVAYVWLPAGTKAVALADGRTLLQTEINVSSTGANEFVLVMDAEQEDKPDTALLQALYEACMELDSQAYTAASWAALAEALAEAEGLLADEAATQQAVDAAYAALLAAREGLVEKKPAGSPDATAKAEEKYTRPVEGGYAMISFKLYDADKIVGYQLNGAAYIALTPNYYSDINYIKVGGNIKGARLGPNELVVFDALGNVSCYEFVLVQP